MAKRSARCGGFTLLEILVVVVIVAILASFAWPSYQRFIERMRMADALALFGTECAAQERYMLSKHHYTRQWPLLDAVPVEVHSPINTDGSGKGYLSSDGTVFYTRGGAELADEDRKPGFAVKFEVFDGTQWFITADRVGGAWGGYKYTLVRPFDDTRAVCIPDLTHADSVLMCTDFMGVETADELPPDPRPVL